MASRRAEQALTNLVENGSSLGKAMIDAGYSPNTAKAPSKVFRSKGLASKVDKVVQQLADERQAILDRMKVTRDEATYRDLTYAMDIVTKNHQLLGGKPTDILKIPIQISGTIADKNELNPGPR